MLGLHQLAIVSLIVGFVCMAIIIADILKGNGQKMMVMNFVYPVTALYAGPLALLAYFTLGRKATVNGMMAANAQAKQKNIPPENTHMKQKPMWQSVVLGTLHCGSGCTLGDLIAESTLLFFPLVIFGRKLYGAWVVDFMLAFGIGILFQYYAIKPMKKLSPANAVRAAIKADTLSLLCWQIGMYGGMAISTFLIFKRELSASEPLFWFVMQLAMLLGFITAYPMNWWLIKSKIKEAM